MTLYQIVMRCSNIQSAIDATNVELERIKKVLPTWEDQEVGKVASDEILRVLDQIEKYKKKLDKLQTELSKVDSIEAKSKLESEIDSVSNKISISDLYIKDLIPYLLDMEQNLNLKRYHELVQRLQKLYGMLKEHGNKFDITVLDK